MSNIKTTFQIAFCKRCGLPHPTLFGQHGAPCTQGTNCCSAFSTDGSMGQAHYGSAYDMSTFATATEQGCAFANLDLICDACLAQAMLEGKIVDISEEGCYVHNKAAIGNHPLALAIRRERMAEELAREAIVLANEFAK